MPAEHRYPASRAAGVVISAFILAIFILPQYVSAATDEVTEIADFRPEANDYDEVVNVANETIETNIDSWNPRPEGIFVGGVIKESLMQLNEVGVGDDNYLRISTRMHFQAGYLSSGASMFVVRLPINIPDDDSLTDLDLKFYELNEGGDYAVTFDSGSVPWEPGIDIVADGRLVAYVENIANIQAHALDPTGEPIWGGIAYESWVSENRAYVRLIAPILTDRDYIITMQAIYEPSVPFEIYWQPSDLCSDNILDTHIAYKWELDPFTNLTRDYPVECDAGWSFVFQQGIGGLATTFDAYYAAGSSILFWKFVETETEKVSGAITFTMEFQVDPVEELNWNLNVMWYNMTDGSHQTVLHSSYWDAQTSRTMIVAGNADNYSSSGVEYDGRWYQVFLVQLGINNATRMRMMTYYDPDLPGMEALYVGGIIPWLAVMPNKLFVMQPSGTTTNAFFAPWCTVMIAPYTYNVTWMAPPPESKTGFWEGVGNWWDEHWVDVLGVAMIIGGAALILTGVGAGFGVALIAAGIGVLLYDNVDWIHNAVDNFVRMVIDGLLWLGNWLWKIATGIWKAVTWFIDALLNAGSNLLAIIIYAAAIILPIVVLTVVTKLMSVFAHIAEGDFAAAAGEGLSLIPGANIVKRKVKRILR